MTTAIAATPELAAEADARFEGIADPVEQALAVLTWAGETFGDSFAASAVHAARSANASAIIFRCTTRPPNR